MRENSGRRIEQLMLELVDIRSDTGTRLEKDVETYIYRWLGDRDYFRGRTDHYGLYPLRGDTQDRAVVWALVKGEGRRTVILMHHHDVVDALDYGALCEAAYQPARSVDTLTMKYVLDRLEEQGADNIPVATSDEWRRIASSLRVFDGLVDKSPSNILLRDLNRPPEEQNRG